MNKMTHYQTRLDEALKCYPGQSEQWFENSLRRAEMRMEDAGPIVLQAARLLSKLLPLLKQAKADKKELFDAANFKHGDDLVKYLESEALLIQYAEVSANTMTEISKLLEEFK